MSDFIENCPLSILIIYGVKYVYRLYTMLRLAVLLPKTGVNFPNIFFIKPNQKSKKSGQENFLAAVPLSKNKNLLQLKNRYLTLQKTEHLHTISTL